MQAILIEFLEHFEFSPAPGNPEIVRGATGVMFPMYESPHHLQVFIQVLRVLDYYRVKGEPGRVQLPLTVSSVM
jgi:hypothetical protein